MKSVKFAVVNGAEAYVVIDKVAFITSLGKGTTIHFIGGDKLAVTDDAVDVADKLGLKP